MDVLRELSDDDDFLELVDIVMHPRAPKKYRNRLNQFEVWNDKEFRDRFRLSKQVARLVIDEIAESIRSESDRNHALTAEEMVLLTLRFLASGSFLQVAGDIIGVDKSTASRAIYKVIVAIARLKQNYINMPVGNDQVTDLKQSFFEISSFPRCIGAIDCTHIKIQSPGGDDAEVFRNRKFFFPLTPKYFYVCLLAISVSFENEKFTTLPYASAPTLTHFPCDVDVGSQQEVEWRCTGLSLMDIPANLAGLTILVVEDAGIEVLKRDSLLPYSSTIRELTLVNLENFYYIETGVFQNLRELQTIYIHRAPKLLKIQPLVFSAILPNLKILRIVNTGLEEMPNLNSLHTFSVLHMIDLEHNHITKISSRQVSKVKSEQLLLNYNNLQVVEEEAFYGSQIAKLSFKGNSQLKNLHKRAFSGLQSLRYIDLSSTAITNLPIDGLREIDVLKAQDTKTLTVFPSIYNFQFIKEAWLTYPYHCCAFKFPHTHNPWEYERHRLFVQQLQEVCRSKNSTVNYVLRENTNPALNALLQLMPVNTSLVYNVPDEDLWKESEEFFHNKTLPMNTAFPVTTALCGNIYRDYHEVECYPAPDAFNPCEDLMGNWGLRVPVWFISLSAVIGNLFVVVVIATSHFRLTVSKFLMCNLAIADLCIGIHLFLIAVVDACSIGVYFNYAISWQEGNGCSVAGFLTIFGNILSVYTLAVITTERWYTITWAIHINRRLKLRTAVRVMIAGWICALCMAILPLVGVSNYSKTSICLPLENNGKADAIYLSTLLAFNALAFALICVGYGSMYRSIREGGNNCNITSVRSDLTVAKRMALLVFTDFACWAPIAFFGLTALLGHPLITVTHTKILLVFFYPLNSCANPCLYALLTQQYRRDFFILMGRYGLCKDRAERHKGAIGGKPLPYGSVPQYRRTGCDVLKNNSTCVGNHRSSRSSLLTTVVSVDVPMTGSRHSARSKNDSVMNAVPEFTLKNMNPFYDHDGFNEKCTSTNNL